MSFASLVVVYGDTHVGGTTALMPRSGIVLKDHEPVLPSPFQIEVIDFWNAFWDRRRTQFKQLKKTLKDIKFVVINMGDNREGVHHESSQVWGTPDQHTLVCIEINRPVRVMADYMFGVSGTVSHVGEEGDSDNMLADLLGYDEIYGRRCNYHIRPILSDVLLDIQHNGPSVGKLPYTIGNSLRNYARGILMTSLLKKHRPPRAIFRAHVHKKCHERIDIENNICDAFITPSFGQLKTQYGHQVASEEYLSDIGGLWLILDRGEILAWDWDVLAIEDTPCAVIG